MFSNLFACASAGCERAVRDCGIANFDRFLFSKILYFIQYRESPYTHTRDIISVSPTNNPPLNNPSFHFNKKNALVYKALPCHMLIFGNYETASVLIEAHETFCGYSGKLLNSIIRKNKIYIVYSFYFFLFISLVGPYTLYMIRNVPKVFSNN